MQGTGIGLAFTKELVIIHNGNIRVESKKGSSSSFTVYLPYDESSVSETTTEIKENPIEHLNHSNNNFLSLNKEQSIILLKHKISNTLASLLQ